MQATQFVRTPDFVSAAATTMTSGIRALLPGAAIDDYVFEPCGYSMNGVDGTAFTTIHVTPEEGFSYASVELCGYAGAALDASAVVAQVGFLATFVMIQPMSSASSAACQCMVAGSV